MNQKPVYIISDAHVGQPLPEIEARKKANLIAFFAYVRVTQGSLIINGDLFDFWFDYGTVIPKRCFWLCSELKRLAEAGVAIDMLVGNHDYWMFTFFQEEMGIRVHYDNLITRLHDKKFYIAHGDGLAPKDSGYRFVRRVFRHPLSVWLYRWVHPDIGVAIATRFSKTSRVYTTAREDRNPDLAPPVYTEVAHGILKQGYDYVIFGHTHQPEFSRFPEGVYANSGNWITDFSYVALENGDLSLRYWAA